MDQLYKIKVYVSHKPIGWVRRVDTLNGADYSVSPSFARGTKFETAAIPFAMILLDGPEPPTSKAATPPVTYQLQGV